MPIASAAPAGTLVPYPPHRRHPPQRWPAPLQWAPTRCPRTAPPPALTPTLACRCIPPLIYLASPTYPARTWSRTTSSAAPFSPACHRHTITMACRPSRSRLSLLVGCWLTSTLVPPCLAPTEAHLGPIPNLHCNASAALFCFYIDDCLPANIPSLCRCFSPTNLSPQQHPLTPHLPPGRARTRSCTTCLQAWAAHTHAPTDRHLPPGRDCNRSCTTASH